MEIRAFAPAAAIAALAGLAMLTAPARAQLSPGKLSQSHAALDTSTSCLQCHRAGKGVDADRCLSCHALLGERIEARSGLHARPTYASCETCHIEHHGRSFELVWWGEDGMAAFDHTETGHPLLGVHQDTACRDCHRASLIHEPGRLERAGKDLDRTFLGLTASCATCHPDPHGDQFEPMGCGSCHGEASWRPTVGFAHDASGFALTGAHRKADCGACHATESRADGESLVRYRGVAAACASCHRDAHRGKLGEPCDACHTTRDWHQISGDRFDHDLTRYPLRDRHLEVACRACHPAGMAYQITAFDRCSSCHADVHAGQFRARADGGECSACHDTRGFVPSRFSAGDHDTTDFPLLGEHRAVACASCHTPIATSDLIARSVAVGGPDAPPTVMRFVLEETGCADCHRSPHPAGTSGDGHRATCTGCHTEEGWRRVTFDHASTRFPLAGAHRPLECVACHAASGRGSDQAEVRLGGAPTTCRACHDDPHAGQLDRPDIEGSCARCHAVEGWKPTHFDHQRDASFALEGAHLRAPCSGCHVTVSIAGKATVRYRPLPTACSGCHRSSTE